MLMRHGGVVKAPAHPWPQGMQGGHFGLQLIQPALDPLGLGGAARGEERDDDVADRGGHCLTALGQDRHHAGAVAGQHIPGARQIVQQTGLIRRRQHHGAAGPRRRQQADQQQVTVGAPQPQPRHPLGPQPPGQRGGMLKHPAPGNGLTIMTGDDGISRTGASQGNAGRHAARLFTRWRTSHSPANNNPISP